ncbi:sulfate anion transporter 1-like isoform X1 [Stylophora pistillata]|uniref:Prestin n=1 Tax=Stylophora pistillata TaxID=50429 RepID=A0A2B4SU84_STYPI|nr:sulfate anion transporter 1-like isoform X1 [Stylophora pistillata]PFX33451.1 Prestin [Stylophora pistillata]
MVKLSSEDLNKMESSPGERSIHRQSPEIDIARNVYDENFFTATKRDRFPLSTKDDSAKKNYYWRVVHPKLFPCSCSWKGLISFLAGLMPIIRWLPKYNVKEDLFPDLNGGVTVAVMHVPQGLAFAMLASLPPVTGLYTAIIPVLVYMIMGTSRHLSVGSFAVICLMVAQVVEREVGSMPLAPTPTPGNDSMSSPSPTEGTALWTPEMSAKMEVALSLSLLVGIIQIIMGAVKMGFLATFLSEPLISGFTTGSAVLVVNSQLKHILGVKVPQISGAFAAVKIFIHMLKNIPSANVGAIITGVLCLIVLIGLKQVNERYKQKMKVPIPAELLVVVVGTLISYGAKISLNYGTQIIGDIPKGLPPLSVPSLSRISNIFSDAFVIAVVIFATNISISKMFAKKRGYSVDPNQELIAYGAGNLAGSFFSCFPICNALARTAVQENLANTQLCSVVVVALVLMVLLFIAPLFFHLPKAILAAVVIANLIGLLKQFSRLRALWGIYKPDAFVWFFSCFGVILLGVDKGLGVGVICALFAVVLTLSRSSYTILGRVTATELYRDVKQCPTAFEVPGVKVLRLESPLYFGNAERFRSALVSTTGLDPSAEQKAGEEVKQKNDEENNDLLRNEDKGNSNRGNPGSKPKPQEKGGTSTTTAVKVDEPKNRIHTVVIDCSSFTYIDSVGLHVLPSLLSEFKKAGIHIYLAGCSSLLIEKFTSSSGEASTQAIPQQAMFPSIHDAVVSAIRSRDHAIWGEDVDKETCF